MLASLPRDLLLLLASALDYVSLVRLSRVRKSLKAELASVLEWKQLTKNGLLCFTRRSMPGTHLRYDMISPLRSQEAVPSYVEYMLSWIEELMWSKCNEYVLKDQEGRTSGILWCLLELDCFYESNYAIIYPNTNKSRAPVWYLNGQSFVDRKTVCEMVLRCGNLEGTFKLESGLPPSKFLNLVHKSGALVAPVFERMWLSQGSNVAQFQHDLNLNQCSWEDVAHGCSGPYLIENYALRRLRGEKRKRS